LFSPITVDDTFSRISLRNFKGHVFYTTKPKGLKRFFSSRIFNDLLPKIYYSLSLFFTSGFWPRVRARALRAPANGNFAASYSSPKN